MMQTDTNMKNTHHHNKDVFMAGVAGILAGAAGITAIALADKDIRRKVGKRAHTLKSSLQDWSADKLHMVDHKVRTLETEEKVKEVKEDEPLKRAMND